MQRFDCGSTKQSRLNFGRRFCMDFGHTHTQIRFQISSTTTTLQEGRNDYILAAIRWGWFMCVCIYTERVERWVLERRCAHLQTDVSILCMNVSFNKIVIFFYIIFRLHARSLSLCSLALVAERVYGAASTRNNKCSCKCSRPGQATTIPLGTSECEMKFVPYKQHLRCYSILTAFLFLLSFCWFCSLPIGRLCPMPISAINCHYTYIRWDGTKMQSNAKRKSEREITTDDRFCSSVLFNEIDIFVGKNQIQVYGIFHLSRNFIYLKKKKSGKKKK